MAKAPRYLAHGDIITAGDRNLMVSQFHGSMTVNGKRVLTVDDLPAPVAPTALRQLSTVEAQRDRAIAVAQEAIDTLKASQREPRPFYQQGYGR